MTIIKMFTSALLATALLYTGVASAYSPEELAKACKKPKFTDFNLSEYQSKKTTVSIYSGKHQYVS